MASGCRRQKICAIRVICVTRNFAAEHKKNPRRSRNALPWMVYTQKYGLENYPPPIKLIINDLQRFTITFMLLRGCKSTEKKHCIEKSVPKNQKNQNSEVKWNSSLISLKSSSEIFSNINLRISSSEGSCKRYLLTNRFCERPSMAYCTVVSP